MKTGTYIVKGRGLHELVAKLGNVDSKTLARSDTIGKCHIFAFEEYFMRTNSHLMSVILIYEHKEDEYEIRLMSGGGGNGILGIDWGSEDSSMYSHLKLINDLCRERHWVLEECTIRRSEDCNKYNYQDTSEEIMCLSCNTPIPAGMSACSKCGWTYN